MKRLKDLKLQYTKHALERIQERNTPDYVLDQLETKPLMLDGRDEYGMISEFRIVKVAKTRFWVGIVRDLNLLTLIRVGDTQNAYKWFEKRLSNYKAVERQIQSLAVTECSQAAMTKDLATAFGVNLEDEELFF